MPRRILTLVVGLTLLASASGALGQIQTEANEAAEDLEEAAAVLDSAETQRAVALNDLVTAVAEWNEVVEQQTAVAFEVAELRGEVSARERQTIELREAIRGRVVDAYMAGGSGLLDTMVVADSVSDVATAEVVLDAIARNADSDLESLDVGRSELDELRAELAAEEERLDARGEAVATLVDDLDILFADATGSVTASHAALLEADAEYRRAYELLQEMTALQRATGRGVERWRAIVEHYFPEDRVEQALEVMWCESRGNPKATHPVSDASGLFQFMEQTWGFVAPRVGYEGVSRYDPEANIAGAAWLLNFTIERGHELGDWGRWSCQPTTPDPA